MPFQKFEIKIAENAGDDAPSTTMISSHGNSGTALYVGGLAAKDLGWRNPVVTAEPVEDEHEPALT